MDSIKETLEVLEVYASSRSRDGYALVLMQRKDLKNRGTFGAVQLEKYEYGEPMNPRVVIADASNIAAYDSATLEEVLRVLQAFKHNAAKDFARYIVSQDLNKLWFKDIPKLTSNGSYCIDVPIDNLKQHLDRWLNPKFGAALDLDPDFQRAHVWSYDQKRLFVEFLLRGGRTSEFLFNCPGWHNSYDGPFVIVDGKQRLSAILDFLDNKIRVFPNTNKDNLQGYRYTDILNFPTMLNIQLRVNDLETRQEVLQWYLELNSGGTPHTKDEIDKVRNLLEIELNNSKNG